MRFITLVKDIFSAPSKERPSELRTWVRPVEVAGAEFKANIPWDRIAERDTLLEKIFHNGQNDFQPRPAPSLSVGDIVVLDEWTFYRMEFYGFKKLEEAELSRLEKLVIRLAWADLDGYLADQYRDGEVAIYRNTGDPEAVERFRKACMVRS